MCLPSTCATPGSSNSAAEGPENPKPNSAENPASGVGSTLTIGVPSATRNKMHALDDAHEYAGHA
jgi:hypothetical protein